MADREGRGFLFPNKDRKEKQPNLTGKVVVEGRVIELAAWTETAKSGVKYLSLKGTDKGPAEVGDAPPSDSTSVGDDDDIPF